MENINSKCQPTFNELLIQEVQEHPELYDQQHRVCTDNGERNMIWEVIANRIDESVTGEFAKKRWLQMRDRYRKELKIALRSMIKPKWPYFKKLSWLDPYLKDTKNISISTAKIFTGIIDGFSGSGADSNLASESFAGFNNFLPYSKNTSLFDDVMTASNAFAAAAAITNQITPIEQSTLSLADSNQFSSMEQFINENSSLNSASLLTRGTLSRSASNFSPDSAIASTSDEGGETNSFVCASTTSQSNFINHLPTASDLPKIFANLKKQQQQQLTNEKQKKIITSFVNKNFDSKIIKTKFINPKNMSNEDSVIIDESIGSSSSPPALLAKSINDEVSNNEMSQDFNTTLIECGKNSNIDNLSKDLFAAIIAQNYKSDNELFPIQLSNSLTNSTLNFAELNLGMLQNTVAVTNSTTGISSSFSNNETAPSINNLKLSSKTLLTTQNNNTSTRARVRNPPYLIRRGGSLKVKNSAFSLVSTATSTLASPTLSSSSVSPALPLINSVLSTRIEDTNNDNFVTSFPSTIVSSAVVTTKSNHVIDSLNTIFSKESKTNKKLISKTNSNNIISNDINNEIQQSSVLQQSLNSITTNKNTTMNNIFSNGTSVDNISLNTGTNSLTFDTNNITLNWMNHLQILAAAATATATSTPIDNNYLVFSDKTPVVPSIKNNLQFSSFPVKLNTADEKNDLNEMLDADWTNDEDLLFARLIVVRLKKFGTKDRRMIRSKINEWIDKKEEEIEKIKTSIF